MDRVRWPGLQARKAVRIDQGGGCLRWSCIVAWKTVIFRVTFRSCLSFPASTLGQGAAIRQMTPVSRRVVFYWLLMLLPTLGAGVGALWLIHREQARLDQQARAAAESQRGAMQARARLIAENVELFMGDVQTGLMRTLRELPPQSSLADRAMAEWEESNPLVRMTLMIDPRGRIVRPPAMEQHAAGRAWLSRILGGSAPWRPGAEKERVRQSPTALDEQRRDVMDNVSKVQSARSAVQEIATMKQPSGRIEPGFDKDVAGERSGWAPVAVDGLLHLIGWRLLGDGTVYGVELNLDEVARRLADLMPAEANLPSGFVLRINGQTVGRPTSRVLSHASLANRGRAATFTLPLAPSVLPGWEVVFLEDPSTTQGSAGRGVLLVSVVMVALFVATILASGTLLLTQARRSESEAMRKTSFVANVSHEFKTPLTTIRLYAELLEQGRVRDVSQQQGYLQIIGAETGRLTRLVNNVLDFSRLEQGRKKYAMESRDIAADVARIIDTQEPRLREEGMVLIRSLPGAPVLAQVDRDAIEQILLNLLDNACKYAAAGREVEVRLETKPGGVRLTVSDRGPGVPTEHRAKIFEKFHRIDDTLTAGKAGTGLGLGIARQLARGMGGDLRFEPREGGGARFVVEIA